MSTKNYLVQHNICIVENWPPQSPDLNVIEGLWGVLKEKIRQKNPKTKDELWADAQEGWNEILNKTITDLYDSLPRRVNEVLLRKGGNTKY